MKTKREILIEELAKGDGSIKIEHLKTGEKVIYNAMDNWLAVNNLNKAAVMPMCCSHPLHNRQKGNVCGTCGQVVKTTY
jgi:hypothetical protein